jgi:sugar phosphate isomerase/epimerase
MNIKYSCPYWGSDSLSPATFIEKAVAAGFDGIEIFVQPPDDLSKAFLSAIDDIRKSMPDFYFIALQLTMPVRETVDEYISKMEKSLLSLAALEPLFINSHTGKDYYSFDENCRVIEAAMNISQKTGIRILHETHRGRFSFHTTTLLPYLKKFPELELVGDYSHFSLVSESMLEDQQDNLDKINKHVSHIHARIGFEEGAQVNDPSAPEWQQHLQTYLQWWEQIIQHKKNQGAPLLTISPEFGPIPYMPTLPFTLQPLSNQWENNLFILRELMGRF